MISQDIVLRVVSFENIIHNGESHICSKLVVEFALSSSTSMDFCSSSSLSVSTFIYSSLMVEQSDWRSNNVHEEEISRSKE